MEVIAIKLATSEESIHDYAKKTLLYHTTNEYDMQEAIKLAMGELQEMRLVDVAEDIFKATLLGEAVVASSLTPEDGLFVHKELKKSLSAFVLDSDMHAL